MSFARAVAEGPIVLDGGLASQLTSTGHDLSDELWSARLLADAPDAIVDAHLAFFRAGASVATTASYQATTEGFRRRGHSPAEAVALLRRSVGLAREAVARAQDEGINRPLWIAASIGPYGAMLADGSEYRGDYGLSVAELVAFHRPRLEPSAAQRPDVLALETVPDAREAEALLTALDGIGLPAWLSFTVADGRTRAGQPSTRRSGWSPGWTGLSPSGSTAAPRPRSARPSRRPSPPANQWSPIPTAAKNGTRYVVNGPAPPAWPDPPRIMAGRRCPARRRLLPGQPHAYRHHRGRRTNMAKRLGVLLHVRLRVLVGEDESLAQRVFAVETHPAVTQFGAQLVAGVAAKAGQALAPPRPDVRCSPGGLPRPPSTTHPYRPRGGGIPRSRHGSCCDP